MFDCGIHELSENIANIIIHDDPDHSYDIDEFEYKFSDELLSEENKEYGRIGVLCPECNKIYSSEFADDDTPIMHDFSLQFIEKIGTRMHLKNGKFGKFWGCMNYPNCKCTLSTTENRKRIVKKFNKLKSQNANELKSLATLYNPNSYNTYDIGLDPDEIDDIYDGHPFDFGDR